AAVPVAAATTTAPIPPTTAAIAERTIDRVRASVMLVLGIESSCDETAAAVVDDGPRLISSIIHSQVAEHAPFGGVVPEIASREHVNRIADIVRRAVEPVGGLD